MSFFAWLLRKLRWHNGLLALMLLPGFSIAQPIPVASATAKSGNFPPHSFLSNLHGINLVDQSGQVFEPASLQDHVVLINFIFTSCASTCPLQTRVLAQVQQELPADVRAHIRFVSVSIDPATDGPEQLKNFATRMQADLAGWTFLTGDAQQIEQLTQRLHLMDESGSGQNIQPQIHRTSIWLVDRQGRMLQRYRGDPPDQGRLIRELSQLSRLTMPAENAL